MLINGWIILGLFVIVGGVIAIVGSVLNDNLESHKSYDSRVHDNYEGQLQNLWSDVNTLEQRVRDLENPEQAPPLESKLCPECNEEKEVVDGDYLCKECRIPEAA